VNPSLTSTVKCPRWPGGEPLRGLDEVELDTVIEGAQIIFLRTNFGPSDREKLDYGVIDRMPGDLKGRPSVRYQVKQLA
jgi:hypothetical protein